MCKCVTAPDTQEKHIFFKVSYIKDHSQGIRIKSLLCINILLIISSSFRGI